MPVAAEVAQALGAPLDVLVVRKLGVPFQPELAMGAVGEGGVRVLDQDVLAATGVTDGSLLKGVKRHKNGLMTTHSVVMRASSGTVRWVSGEHRTKR